MFASLTEEEVESLLNNVSRGDEVNDPIGGTPMSEDASTKNDKVAAMVMIYELTKLGIIPVTTMTEMDERTLDLQRRLEVMKRKARDAGVEIS